MKACNNEIH